ncbi:Hypothetical protein A7982_01795 [Minicystis rosea]|nr:Hypothetical protein A7982_01795 [Minicystis rosea]
MARRLWNGERSTDWSPLGDPLTDGLAGSGDADHLPPSARDDG